MVLTRPAHRNKRLVQGLTEVGVSSINAPALKIVSLTQSIPDQYLPEQYDLVVFVSGVAATHYLKPLCYKKKYEWPVQCKIGTVGISTKATAQNMMQKYQCRTDQIQWRHPPVLQSNHDSEQLWLILKSELDTIEKALIVRGMQGREWLKDRLQEANIYVDILPVYDRQPNYWGTEIAQNLIQAKQNAASNQSSATKGLVFLITSGESAQAIFSNLHRLNLLPLCKNSVFVVIHERIEKQVQSLYASAGFKDKAVVKRCIPTYDSMLSALITAAQNV